MLALTVTLTFQFNLNQPQFKRISSIANRTPNMIGIEIRIRIHYTGLTFFSPYKCIAVYYHFSYTSGLY